jgi:hypothetical protein
MSSGEREEIEMLNQMSVYLSLCMSVLNACRLVRPSRAGLSIHREHSSI